jgi:hypothetical protein
VFTCFVSDRRCIWDYPNGRQAPNWPGTTLWHITVLQLTTSRWADHPVYYCAGLPLVFRLGSGFFAAAAIPAARSFAIRLMSFTGTGLLSVKWIVPFLRS